jgi:GPH family glycoside/pentoside/hexuronide:cation symporter
MQKKIPLLTKIVYGSGDFGYSMTNSIIAAYFLLFLTDVVGMSPLWRNAILIGRTRDYINDPLIAIFRSHEIALGPPAAILAFWSDSFCGYLCDVVYKPAFTDQNNAGGLFCAGLHPV